MDKKLDEQIGQESQEKKPLSRKICVQAIRKSCREEWPGIWIGYAIATIIVLGISLLFFWWPYWWLYLLGVVWLVANWYLGMGYFVCILLTLCGVCKVSLDVMCGGEIRTGEHGTQFYYFCFSHHGSMPVSKWMYENIPAGQRFYVVSVPGAFRRPMMIYPLSQYEWVGNADKLTDYTNRYAAQGPQDGRTENTILARRPLTQGRKWKLTNEEIVRDLREHAFWTNERLIGVTLGVPAIGALLFFASAEAAVLTLAIAGAACVALWIQHGVLLHAIKAHRFVVKSDTLMDKDPVTRGVWRWRTTRYLLSFRKGTYYLPPQDESVYRDAELGDTFLIVRLEGKHPKIRAVYNTLDVEWDGEEEE